MSISSDQLEALRNALSLSITKKPHHERTSSLVFSSSGATYAGGIVESDTNTFNIPSEHVALMLSTISNDYRVSKLVTMVESPQGFAPSPLVLKVIKDHSIRTQIPIAYSIVDPEGTMLFSYRSVDEAIPFYTPLAIALARTDQTPSPYWKASADSDESMLKTAAIEGLAKNFPLYDSASGYATAVVAGSGKIYFAGQYSSPDKRLGLHSEVNAVLAALMSGEKSITRLGLVSTKYPYSPCHMCGNCRQFLAEMSQRWGKAPELFLFAKDEDECIQTDLKSYLPSSWESKEWQN